MARMPTAWMATGGACIGATDFAYIRDEMGWPPDINARRGYKSFVYVFGSGLANDNTSSTEKGGYQSQTYTDGAS